MRARDPSGIALMQILVALLAFAVSTTHACAPSIKSMPAWTIADDVPWANGADAMDVRLTHCVPGRYALSAITPNCTVVQRSVSAFDVKSPKAGCRLKLHEVAHASGSDRNWKVAGAAFFLISWLLGLIAVLHTFGRG